MDSSHTKTHLLLLLLIYRHFSILSLVILASARVRRPPRSPQRRPNQLGTRKGPSAGGQPIHDGQLTYQDPFAVTSALLSNGVAVDGLWNGYEECHGSSHKDSAGKSNIGLFV